MSGALPGIDVKKIGGNAVIYELRTYTLKPGALGQMLKAASTVSHEIRGDNYGKLEGYWSTEIGALNQVVHLWSYSDFEERARLRKELAANPRWRAEYTPLIQPLMMRQDIRLLNAIRAPVAPVSSGNIYELRNYRAKTGGAVKQWLDAFTAALPAREEYSKIVGLWQIEFGQPNEVCHIWAYPSLNARAEARTAAVKDPVWQDFLGKGSALLDEMHSTIMLPAPHSPLK
jgi:NIPSNAP